MSWQRTAVILWLVLGIAVSVRTLVQPAKHTVYPIFVAGGARWWHDLPLYVKHSDLDYFRYTPTFAVVMTPFAGLDLRTGGILWSWLNLAVYAAGLGYAVRDVLPVAWTVRRRAVFFVLALAGGLSPIWNAQSNPLVIGLLLLAASAVVRQRWWTAAFLLIGPGVLKLTPIAVGLLLCALWPRKLAGRFALALGVAALVPFLTRPSEVVLEQYRGWLVQMHELREERWPGFRDAWAGWVTVRHLATGGEDPVPIRAPVDTPWYRVLQLLTAAMVLAWCLWQQRRGLTARPLVTVTLGLGVAWLMLLGPATEFPTYVLLAPLLGWAILEPSSGPWQRTMILTAGVLALVFGWNAVGQRLVGFPLAAITLPVASALFTVWLIGYAQRAQRLMPESCSSASIKACVPLRPQPWACTAR